MKASFNFSPRLDRRGHGFRSFLCSLAFAAFVATAHGITSRSAFDLHRSERNDGIRFSVVVKMVSPVQAVTPLMGLLAAVACTHILQRRRSAQVRALAEIDN